MDKQNNFSFWFPKIKDNRIIPVPQTFYIALPEKNSTAGRRLYEAFFMENPKEDVAVVQNFVEDEVLPKLKEQRLTGHIFVKNATFSNKFMANGSCNLYGTANLAQAIININNAALGLGADGVDEIVVRKFIEYDRRNTPCIYNGLPLRSEFRVFYNFATRQPLYVANYWDYDHVYPHLYEATDKIIFEHERERLETVFEQRKNEVLQMVAVAMRDVYGLKGQWSVDILLDESGKFWLIDMGVAQNSTYWNSQINLDNAD